MRTTQQYVLSATLYEYMVQIDEEPSDTIERFKQRMIPTQDARKCQEQESTVRKVLRQEH